MRVRSCGSVWSIAFSVTRAGDVGMDVDVQARVARQREQQLLHAHVVDHHAVGLGRAPSASACGSTGATCTGGGIVAVGARLVGADVRRGRLDRRLAAAAASDRERTADCRSRFPRFHAA